MRSFYDPNDKYDQEELARLNAEPWMVEQLALNPDYVHWGPGEDYMKGEGDGWAGATRLKLWSEMKIELDEWNEVVHFYFELNRESERCLTCGGSGYHVDAQWVTESFYRHSSPFTLPTPSEREARAVMERICGGNHESHHGRGAYPDAATFSRYGRAFREFCEEMRDHGGAWHDRITEDEVQALIDGGRLPLLRSRHSGSRPTAVEVNRRQGMGTPGLDTHDAINRGILIRARCARLGLPLHCTTCEGHGYVFTEPAASLGVVLWVLHPRKGASAGMSVQRIERSELSSVYAFLRGAAERNAERFAKIVAL